MLPVHRVIGHKEWAPGRKSDPTYSMNWRRDRVAAFKSSATKQEDDIIMAALSEAEQKELLYAVRRIDKVTDVILDDPVIFEGVNLPEVLRRTLKGIRDVQASNAALAKAVDVLATAAAGGDKVNADELRAVIREEMAKVVRVEVSVDGDKPTP